MNISDIDHKAYQESINNPDSAYNRSLQSVMNNQARWTSVEGISVLRVKDSNFVAVPVTGRKNSAHFQVIDLNDRSDIVCQITKKDVYGWLCKASISANN